MESSAEAAAAAASYDKVQVRYQGTNGVNLINRLSLGKGSVILELGCGTGYLSSILADRVGIEGKVIGVDPKSERIQIAQTKYGSVQNLQFSTGSSEDFPSGPYDFVISVHVLHWIEDKEAAFRNVFNNLKAGGIFAFICTEDQVTKEIEVINQRYGKDPLFYNCSSQQYEALAIKCGFEIEFKSSESVVYNFNSVDEYIEWTLASLSIDSTSVDPTAMSDIRKTCVVPRFEGKNLEYIM